MEKHARHIHDLKIFYESELLIMNERLQRMEREGREVDSERRSSRRSLNFDSCMDEMRSTPMGKNSPLSGSNTQMAPMWQDQEEDRSADLEWVRKVEEEKMLLEGKLQALLQESKR